MYKRQALTEAGERYLERCRGILEDIEVAEAEAAGAHIRPCGRLRVQSLMGMEMCIRDRYTPETLLPCLVEIRRQGWCIVDQELEVGLRSLAVPVRDSAGHVLAALNVGTHAGRVSRAELESRFLPLLLEASRELSARLFT